MVVWLQLPQLCSINLSQNCDYLLTLQLFASFHQICIALKWDPYLNLLSYGAVAENL